MRIISKVISKDNPSIAEFLHCCYVEDSARAKATLRNNKAEENWNNFIVTKVPFENLSHPQIPKSCFKTYLSLYK